MNTDSNTVIVEADTGALARKGILHNPAFQRFVQVAGVGIFVLFLVKFDVRKVGAELAHSDLVLVVLGMLMTPLYQGFRAIRWTVFAHPGEGAIPEPGRFWRHVKSFLNAAFWGVVTPGRVGDFLKCVDLRKEGMTWSASIAAGVVERFLDGAAVLVVLGLGCAAIPESVVLPFSKLGYTDIPMRIFGLPILAGAVVIFAGFLLVPRYLLAPADAVATHHGGFRAILFQIGLWLRGRTRLDRIKIVAGTLAAFVPIGLALWLFCRAVSINISPDQVLVIWAVLGIATIVPAGFLGTGSREAALIYFLPPSWEIAEPKLIALSTLVLVQQISTLVLVGPMIVRDRLKNPH